MENFVEGAAGLQEEGHGGGAQAHPPPAAVEQQEGIDAVGGPLTQAEANFCRKRFQYEIGQDFSQFVRKFNAQAFLYNPRALVYNSMLYESLTGVAATMGDPYDPTLPEYRHRSKQEYVELLREVFEPASQTEIAINEFNERKQLTHEYVGLYFHSKLQLFHRAYTPAQRNYSVLYKKTINGLINKQLRFMMAQYRPEPINNHVAFAAELGRQVTIIREHLGRGDIDEEAAAGTVSYKATQMYFNQQGAPPRFKEEPINAIPRERLGNDGLANLGEGIMAMRNGNIPKRACYYCGEEGHFIAQCPRKTAGLPRAVQAMEGELGDGQQEAAEDSVNYAGQRYAQRGGYNGNWRGRQYYGQYSSGNGNNYRGRGRDRYKGRGKNSNGGRLFFLVEDEETGRAYQEEARPEEVAAWLEEQEPRPAGDSADVNQLTGRVAGLRVTEQEGELARPAQERPGMPKFFLENNL